jgi:transglycosylase-like protein with SLT domain
LSLRTGEPRLRRLIDAIADTYELPRFSYKGETFTPGELLEGIVLTESSGDPRARRYEPHQDKVGRTDAPTDPDMPGRDDASHEDDASYGLMQVMGYNWRRILGLRPGTPIDFSAFAFDPVFSLRAGVLILVAELKAVYVSRPHADDSERVVRALCRYNGGPTGDQLVDVAGAGKQDLRRREYVDKVFTRCGQARADRIARGWR